MARLDDRDPEKLLPLTHVEYHVLLSLKGRSRHGYGMIKDVESQTHGRTVLETGTLYGALKRLSDRGLIADVEATAAEPHPGRARRLYVLTGQGRKVLEAEARRLWEMVELARARDVLPEPEAASGEA